MHFYRPLGLIKALTFDLDDTLYDNRPVMERTEQQVISFMKQQFPQLSKLDINGFTKARLALLEQQPDIYHDVSEWRRRAFEAILIKFGYNKEAATEGAGLTMEHFHYWRNCIEVPQSTHMTLSLLATRYPLMVITNGNAEPKLFGLSDYFQIVLRAGPNGRAKPFGDMYLNAVQRLNISPEHLLHVGDDLVTDVAGAIRQGLQACWINDHNKNLIDEPSGCLLPHIEISRLDSLCLLI